MAHTITGQFDTRREAEMAVERLVQEHGMDRGQIHVGAAGAENTVGTTVFGADTDAATGTPEEAAQAGRIAVAVAVEVGSRHLVLDAFAACGVAEVTASGADDTTG